MLAGDVHIRPIVCRDKSKSINPLPLARKPVNLLIRPEATK